MDNQTLFKKMGRGILMSKTNIYGIKRNGDVTFYKEIDNSLQGAPHVWNTLIDKYKIDRSDMFDALEESWGYFNKNFYEKNEDVILGSTFDQVIVLKGDFDKLIESFSEYVSIFDGSNFSEQISVIESMKEDPDIIGVAWLQISNGDRLWDYGYDEGMNKSIPYNIFKGNKHWNLFEELEGKR